MNRKWKSGLPKKEGWYWVSIQYPRFRHETIIYVDKDLTYSSPTDWDSEARESISKLSITHFIGPLSQPESPND